MLPNTGTIERFQAGSLSLSLSLVVLFFFLSKIRRSNFLFLNAAHAAHMHFELTEEDEASFRISN